MKLLLLTLLPLALVGQNSGDVSHSVADGGIKVPGWKGSVDPGSTSAVNDARLAKEHDALHVTTGPAITLWQPENTAHGNYTVKATFTEPMFMSLNTHPHPYGIVIAGNDMGTPQQTELYCAAYGNGNFIVRGFGPQPFQMNGRREPSAAVHKAPAPGLPVTQEIAMTVAGDKVSCSINGMTVATYDKAALVGPGKLKSLDGVFGIRAAHNTDILVNGLSVTQP